MRAPAVLAGALSLLLLLIALSLSSARASPPPRVLSLDQCADQYVLALSPRSAIVGLSTRAGNPDSYLAVQVHGLPIRRVDAEAALAARPQVVVRYWGGEPRLLADLQRRGAQVARIEEASDFDGVRRNIRLVAATLGRPAAGERLIAGMNARLTASAGAWGGRGALYLTSGGATAGAGTLIDSILRAAGLRNLAGGAGYREVSLEKLELDPPSAIVEGFFDPASQAQVRWGPGRHAVLARLRRGRAVVSLPGALLGCPAWFAADAVAMIAAAAPTGHRPCAKGPARCA